VDELRARIARGEYEIDSARIAEALVAKLAVLRRARAQLLAAGDGARPARLPFRTGRFTRRPSEVAARDFAR
jgi:hypothetical protein